MAKIVTLEGNPFTPEAKEAELNEHQKDLVGILEDWLSRVKAGQYKDIGIVGVCAADEAIDTVTSDNPSLHGMITGLEILKFRLLENRNASYRNTPSE
jgi:hypothetical protein